MLDIMLKLKKYVNRRGASGVIAYCINGDTVSVLFSSWMLYTYDRSRIGDVNFQKLVRCAVDGIGLNGFIVKFIGKEYTQKCSVQKSEVEIDS